MGILQRVICPVRIFNRDLVGTMSEDENDRGPCARKIEVP